MMLFYKSPTRAASLGPEYHLDSCRLQPYRILPLGT